MTRDEVLARLAVEQGECAWYAENADRQTHPVGQKKPNAWGLHDMHGNVWEWVADWYTVDYYARGPREDPPGPERGGLRILRGGSWRNFGHECRSAFRHVTRQSLSNSHKGFRAAVTIRQE